MKSLGSKKIAAVVAGSALLAASVAYAVPISYNNIPIIGSNGQPLVKIVVGNSAKPIDAVSAGNIAAAIGNLAYGTVPVTASVNTTMAQSLLHVVATSSASSTQITNGSVSINVTGEAFARGSYTFDALIGSVLNRGVKTGNPAITKAVGDNSTAGYNNSQNEVNTQIYSPYAYAGYVPVSITPTAATNGGGVTFTTFRNGSYDDILRITNTQLSTLLSDFGNYGENEYLWITGFPVFDQQKGVNSFALLDAAGAYQVTFTKPIPLKNSNNGINLASFMFLGQNWTIVNGSTKGLSQQQLTSPQNVVEGGSLELASAVTPLTAVPVGGALYAFNKTIKVVLQGIGQANSNGISPASVAVYYHNGSTPTNQTVIYPGTVYPFNVSNNKFYVYINQTFAGISGIQYAKMRIYANVYNITSGKQFNATYDPNWYTELLWTNSSNGGTPNALYSIIIYNTNATTLLPGQSITFATQPAYLKLTFAGETQTSGNFDPITITSTYAPQVTYENPGGVVTPPSAASAASVNVTAITEPAEELVVTSKIPNAFQFANEQSNQVTYDLTPYALYAEGYNGNTAGTSGSTVNTLYATINGLDKNSNAILGNYITPSNPLTVIIKGYTSNGQPTGATLTFNGYGINPTNGETTSTSISAAFANVTEVQLSRPIPADFGISVYEGNPTTQKILHLANLTTPTTPYILYTVPGKNYYQTTVGTNVIYNQQNGQTPTTFTISDMNPTPLSNGKQYSYYKYSMQEYPVPFSTSKSDYISFNVVNSTAGTQSEPLFILNYSAAGTPNNVSYTSTQGTTINVQPGFRTEKGSEVASITPYSLTIDMAKAIDELEFVVGPSNATVTKQVHTYNFTVGQNLGVLGLPNATVVKVNGKAVAVPTNYTIEGLDNLSKAVVTTPAQADQVYSLENLLTSSTPLVILANEATPGGSYISVGSGYVNAVSAAVEKQYNLTVSPTMNNGKGYLVQAFPSTQYGSVIYVAGYYGNQTLEAADSFIQQLYNLAASGS